MNANNRLPIWRDSSRLLLEVEQAVRQFPRYHKYTIGTDMRRQTMYVSRMLVRALNSSGNERLRQVRNLQVAVDGLKVMIQLAKEIKALQNFRQFQVLSELAVAIGRQGGSWYRQLSGRSSGPESGVNK